MNLVECRGLRLGYASRLVASCPDFTVGTGDFLAVVGPNGSGKTTLLKTVAGLIQPLGGSLGIPEEVSRGGIGYLPQTKDIQRDFPASVTEVVESGCQALRGMRPFYTGEEKQMVRSAIERFGIGHLARRSFRELSGGQRQRVLLARALCAPRKILLLDEPSTGLDPDAQEELHSLLGKVNKSGLSIMMVTHDLSPALRLASHVLTLGEQGHFERNTRHA